jgi:HPt (histidine-containing phosphotransfer) domain-containing protein
VSRERPPAAAARILALARRFLRSGKDAMTPTDAIPPPLFDAEGLGRRVRGRAKLLHDLINLFDREGPRLAAVCQDEIAAGRLEAAAIAAHTLKGASSFFGAAAVVSLAVQVEELTRAGDRCGAERILPELTGALAALRAALKDLALATPLE